MLFIVNCSDFTTPAFLVHRLRESRMTQKASEIGGKETLVKRFGSELMRKVALLQWFAIMGTRTC